MPRFAANLTLMFNEVPFLDRFERATKAGFEAVEFQFLYEWPVSEVAARLQGNGLTAVLHNFPAGDWAQGDRGLACQPRRQEEFRASVPQAIGYARALGVDRLHCLSGIEPEDPLPTAIFDTLIANLRWAADECAKAGLKVLIEPINRHDVPGYFVRDTTRALQVMDAVGADNLLLQYDLYHAQRSEGELAATMERLLPRIGHMQIADNPGRHEPGTGEINYPFLFQRMDALGYAGWVGCEYIPLSRTEDGLAWMPRGRPDA
ncbi:hydroxypyruvate isomerase [Piscinibacter terrae]|uniref:Hydroxypyruvate isomerase n=1 Tax=Piscinibacter terrae TaxID=2496871 RepID=A0A3N7JWU9_9BURK|nr:hydroxypyruvate isomerase [Albitalea terrae]RQP25299.1 hydroxypyruvate isomerase [Albitalea terrae]